MADYIERRPLFDALYDAEAITAKGIGIFRNFPAAEVHKISHGHWRERNFSENCTGFECSVCHTTWDANTSFCPFCGTKMDGEA